MIRSNLLVDSHGRVLRDLRISVTDRCNFRCLYCLPETEEAARFYRTRFPGRNTEELMGRIPNWQPRSQILTFEEIGRVVRVFAGLGIRKIRLTGGEPLLRRGIERLVKEVSALKAIEDLALTTNGFLFPEKGRALKEAGLRRISFSLDSLQKARFREITGRDGLDAVMESIDAAQQLGLSPVKVNAVIIRGLNDSEIVDLAAFGRERRLSMRFIEFMPLDSARSWLKELVVPGREILARIQEKFPLEKVENASASETARRWRFPEGGEIGIIAPVSEPFCGHCNRIRMTADGKIRTCLFSIVEHDLKPLLRGDASDDDIAQFLQEVVTHKEPGHRIGQPEFVPPSRSMSCIGG